MPALTLDRLLASIGFGSRKEARALVRMGLVELDGNVLDDPFMELKERPENITVNGEEVPTVEKLYVMLHKPVDFECSHHPRDHRSVYELLPDRFSAMGIQSAGRLDADSSGIILFSNQGDFIHKVESPKKGCLKRYRVTLAREFTAAQEKELLAGVMLKDERRPVLARENRRGTLPPGPPHVRCRREPRGDFGTHFHRTGGFGRVSRRGGLAVPDRGRNRLAISVLKK